jgi:uncharacterized protein (DUF362 family)
MNRWLERRKFLPLAALGVTSAHVEFLGRDDPIPTSPPGYSSVTIIRAADYSVDLVDRMVRGAQQCELDVQGKRVLLKPNFVEFDSSTSINTDVSVVAAAVELFERLGAAEVLIGEGPGHRRDSLAIAEQAGYRKSVPGFDRRFVDLNRDDVLPIVGFARRQEQFWFPAAALKADLIVSLAKMKTHHWAVATLAMKNLFGLVPGSVYGWPKNILHHIGIPQSIIELNRVFRKTFAIVDGIVGMQGNGPIQGTPAHSGVLVMGSDVVAVDATCCRIMGIDPLHVPYLRSGAFLGHLDSSQIEQRGELVRKVRTNYALIEQFRHLRLA